MQGPGAFRLFLATAVLVSHVTVGRFGVVAVMVFFILSGYWVTRMYQQKYRRKTFPILTFYLSRFLRLWPAFAAAVLIAITLLYVQENDVDSQQFSALLMLGVASNNTYDPLQISWTLDIEMQFYLLLPLLLIVTQSAKTYALRIVIVAALTIIAWGFRAIFSIETVFQYLPAFTAGCAIFLLNAKFSRRMAIISAGLFAIVGAFLAANSLTQGVIVEVPMSKSVIRFISLFWALLLIPYVAWNVRQIGCSFDRALGDFSYSLYLTHFPVIRFVKWMMDGIGDLPLALFQTVASFAVAVIFYVLIDRFFERIRARILAGSESEKGAENLDSSGR